MKALIDDCGRVTITYESQAENLDAPADMIYLPCNRNCGELLIVPRNVISMTCGKCQIKEIGEALSTR